MPVEAVHLSAFLDSVAGSRAEPLFADPRRRDLGRLGALIIDLPYFEHFPRGVARYLLKRPTATSRWGELLHLTRPVEVAHSFFESVRGLRAQPRCSSRADDLLAVCLGYVSHLAVDRSLHPLVNRLARECAERDGRAPGHHHGEVEKFHSVLFHEARLGFDFMGRRELREHIAVDAHAIHGDPTLRDAWLGGLGQALGRAPSASELKRWAKGYGQFVALVSSPFGKLIAPEAQKERARHQVYVGSWGSFDQRFDEAVTRSRESMDAALAAVEDPSGSVAAFQQVLPEGPIDLD